MTGAAAPLLEGGIAEMLDAALGEVMLSVTLRKPTRVSDGQGGFTSGFAEHAAKGFVEDYSDLARANGIPGTDRKIVILAKSTAVTPARDDEVTLRGRTYRVVAVASDPALATYELQAR